MRLGDTERFLGIIFKIRLRKFRSIANLKQIGTGINQYCNTFDGRFPFHGGNESPWYLKLSPYVGEGTKKYTDLGGSGKSLRKTVFICESSRVPLKPMLEKNLDEANSNGTSYTFNRGLFGGGTGWGDYNSTNKKYISRKMNELKEPSQSFTNFDYGGQRLVFPVSGGSASYAVTQVFMFRGEHNYYSAGHWHNQKSNVLFADAHVTSAKEPPKDQYLANIAWKYLSDNVTIQLWK